MFVLVDYIVLGQGFFHTMSGTLLLNMVQILGESPSGVWLGFWAALTSPVLAEGWQNWWPLGSGLLVPSLAQSLQRGMGQRRGSDVLGAFPLPAPCQILCIESF